ncbi:MAG TPA: TolC family protein [Myxococcota bacterium]|nr:TolC family protein [Myxococcota bacterium]
MNLRGTLLLVFAATLVPAVVQARPLAFDEAVSRALSANPRLRAAKFDVAAAKARTAEAIGRHFGEVDLVGVYNAYDDARLVRPIAGPLNPAAMGSMPFDQNQFHFGVTWQIPLLASGRLITGDRIARDMARAASATDAHAREEVRYNVRAAYRNLLVLSHALDAVDAYVKALEEDAHAAELKVKVEAWAPVNAQKVLFALEGARAQKARIVAQKQSAEAMLAALMGEDPPTDGFQVADLPGEPSPAPTPALQELLETARAGRHDLQAAREALNAARHRRDQARLAFLPEIGVQGSWLGHVAPSVSGTLGTVDFGLYLKIPVLVGATRWYAMNETTAEAAAAAARERAKALEVAGQVSDASARLEAARAQYRAGISRRDLGHEVARVEQLRLVQGTGHLEDYLAARAQEAEGEAAYWQSRYDLETAMDYLEFATGASRMEGGRP